MPPSERDPTVPAVDLPQDVAIRAEGLGKAYRLFRSNRQRLRHAVLGRLAPAGEEFWAARGVGFDIKRGDSFAFVGPNGSGKSTVLGMIAGTITPTEGRVAVRGRVAALLQLGAGFDNDFTGRENAYMNGAILGMTRAEIDERFDGIAAFADIGEFIDQPVRTYSSGMRARLAFSVATSVDPDVLIVDEALSVGDNAFQQKCVARVKKLVDSGLTFLFVSHALAQVKGMCQQALYLDHGRQRFFGGASEAVELYLSSSREDGSTRGPSVGARKANTAVLDERLGTSLRYGTGEVKIADVSLHDEHDRPVPAITSGGRARIRVEFECLEGVPAVCVGIAIRDHAGIDLFCTTTLDEGSPIRNLAAGQSGSATFTVELPVRRGRYGVTAYVATPAARAPQTGAMPMDYAEACLAFEVLPREGRPVFHRVHLPTTVDVAVDAPAASANG